MTFIQAISSGLHRYFDFKTRSSRSEYWYWTLFLILVSVVATVLDELLFGGRTILDPISSVALFIPGLAVAARRLHDVGRSGWWLLISLTLVGVIYPLLYWHLNPSIPGSNRYGPNPSGVLDGNHEIDGSDGICVACGSALEKDANFCSICGSKTVGSDDAVRFCSNCGLRLTLEADSCFSCGISV